MRKSCPSPDNFFQVAFILPCLDTQLVTWAGTSIYTLFQLSEKTFLRAAQTAKSKFLLSQSAFLHLSLDYTEGEMSFNSVQGNRAFLHWINRFCLNVTEGITERSLQQEVGGEGRNWWSQYNLSWPESGKDLGIRLNLCPSLLLSSAINFPFQMH